jgi:drug/metabolite transporter (DMT)-like permease
VGQYHPLTYVTLRLILSSGLHLSVYLFGRRAWPRPIQLWRQATVLGILGTAIPLVGIVSALEYQSSGVTSMLLTVSPALTVVLAHFALPDETLDRRKVLGVALAFSGALLLALRGESGLPQVQQANPLGYLLVILAMLSASSATVFARRSMQALDPFDVSSVRMISASVAVAPISLLIGGLDFSRVDGWGVYALGHATLFGTFLGMMLSFTVIKRFGATAGALASYIIPVVAGLGGVVLLDERISLTMLLGLVLIVAGLTRLNQGPQAAVRDDLGMGV